MREYAQLSPKFWTGPTGRAIRARGPEAQLVAVYLVTCPASNMIGLYYLPLVTLAHETNLEVAMARQVLAALEVLDFCHYDDLQETVWVTTMAFYQVGETVETKDKRWPAMLREVLAYANSPFFPRFVEIYGEAFHLAEALQQIQAGTLKLQAPSKGLLRATRKRKLGADELLASPSQGPLEALADPDRTENKPLRCQEQEQGTGTRAGTGTGAGTAGACQPLGPAAALPGFLVPMLEAVGLTLPASQQALFQKLGRQGILSALAKLRAKGGGKSPAGLLVSHGPELAQEGWVLLQEAAVAALREAPEALKDPRWLGQPQDLREDLEVQAAWAAWIQAEQQRQASPRDDEAQARERGRRRVLAELMATRHPDPDGLHAQLAQLLGAGGFKGLCAAAQKLFALTQILGLAPLAAPVP